MKKMTERHGPLPYEPQSIDMLRLRFAMALVNVYDTREVLRGRDFGIGQNRAHVFDCPDGMRLIISRERSPDGLAQFVHISVSWDSTCEFYREVEREAKGLMDALRLVERRFRDLSGDTRPLRFLGMTAPKGVPHFVVEEHGTWEKAWTWTSQRKE